jgi:hypothetical protein
MLHNQFSKMAANLTWLVGLDVHFTPLDCAHDP